MGLSILIGIGILWIEGQIDFLRISDDSNQRMVSYRFEAQPPLSS